MPVRLAVTALLLLRMVAAQDAFDVASIKPSDPRESYVQWLTYPGGRVVITNHTLTMLIEEAYGVSLYRISGGPRWTGEDVYSITAKAPAGSAAATFMPARPDVPPAPEFLPMLKTLLADRFGLKVHRETRQLPVYELVIAKGGSKLQGAHDPSAEPESSLRRGVLEAHNRNIAWLAAILERHVQRTIVDRTGLTGTYDFDIQYDPRRFDDAGDVEAHADRPPLRTALQTQLGLMLEVANGPVEVLVIDKAKKPNAN